MSFEKTWLDAKSEFETLTKASKPKESKGFRNAFGSHTGLSGALEECDKARAKAETLNNTDENVKLGVKLSEGYEASYRKFAKACAGYCTVLGKAIKDEVSDRGPGEKAIYEKALSP